ncbi:MAG: hypothetical protein D6786_00465 [Gammaproteobacteria bacterium]|nr:MAG: hypothetical protein D6786_00465 [Gammaproteobacteria bacterium]
MQKFSPWSLASVALILAVSTGFGIRYQCPGCFLLLLSGPFSLVALALDWVPGVARVQAGMAGLLLSGIALGLLAAAMVLAHQMVRHPAAAVVSLLGGALWLLIALGVVSALA